MGFIQDLFDLFSGGAATSGDQGGDRYPHIGDLNAWTEVRRLPAALIYKHSPICHVSTTARRQVEKFATCHPDIPVFLVDVLNHRPVSLEIARELAVPHESPQAILLIGGAVRWHDSHWGIKATALEKAVSTPL